MTLFTQHLDPRYFWKSVWRNIVINVMQINFNNIYFIDFNVKITFIKIVSMFSFDYDSNSVTFLWSLCNIPTSCPMSADMLSHMVWPRESSCTNVALKRFQPCMFPLVSGQFIRPGKLVITLRPGAAVGLLSSVCTHVGLRLSKICFNIKLQTETFF